MIAFLSLVTTGLALAQGIPYQEEPCISYGGKCGYDSCCSNNNYVVGKCPSQAGNVRCCNTNPTCAYNEDPCQAENGECRLDSTCTDDRYVSGKCPTQAGSIKCCFDVQGVCGTTVQSLACDILNHNSIYLLPVNPSGVDDGADAASNMADACNNLMSKRSSYTCSSGQSPGGYVCPTQEVLQYILDVANNYASPSNQLQVNSITGACHSSTSRHYSGYAVDFQIKANSPYESYMSMCAVSGAVENLGPGTPGHSTHTHCAFN